MARRKRKRSGIDDLLAAPWWLSFVLAALAYVVVAQLLPALLPVASPLRTGLAPAFYLLGALASGLLILIGTLAWWRQRPAPSSQRRPGPQLTATPASVSPVPPNPPPNSPDPLDELMRLRSASSPAPTPARPDAWSMDVLRRMEWKRFEHVVAGYYSRCGFRTELQAAGADGGVDVRLYRGESPAPIALVQCKAWDSKAVGVALVRELLGVMTIERVNAGIFVTTSTYSDDASALSGAHKLRLISGDEFLQMIRALPEAAQAELLGVATEGEWATPTCPSCGTTMLRRQRRGDGSPFWGCRSFPSCKRTFPFRPDE